MTGYEIGPVAGIVVGWALGILSAIITGFILTNIKDLKLKRRIACDLKEEIERNTNMIVPILKKAWESPESVYEFRREVYDTHLANLSFLGPKLAAEIRRWYDLVDIEFKALKHPADKNIHEKLRFFHEKEWGKEIDSFWEEIQKSGFEIVAELDRICASSCSWDIVHGV